MNGLNKHLAVAFVSIAILFVGMAYTATFPEFDAMSDSAKAEFVADMVARTEQALRDEGKSDLAEKMERLFVDIAPGDRMSLGIAELERNIARARLADLHGLEKNPNAKRVYVEDALFVTLKKNGIELSGKGMDNVIAATLKFHSMTNAEFHALSPTVQRHVVKLFAGIGFQDYCFRDILKSKKDTFLGLNEKSLRDLDDVLKSDFPASGEQAGFAGVAKTVEAERVTAPDHVGPLLSLVDYILTELDTRILMRDRQLEERSVLMPDGRHAYVDSDDKTSFLIFQKDGTSYKLEPSLQPLAQRLRHCMETGDITDGARAQAVCLAALTNNSPKSPKASPPPERPTDPPRQSKPSTVPAIDPNDDPIGPGGFITPSAQVRVQVCVPGNLVDHQSWDNPPVGGKMKAFRDATAKMILDDAPQYSRP